MKPASNLLPTAAAFLLSPVLAALPDVGDLERVNTDSFGGEADKRSDNPAISADNRYVAFDSWATNLVPGSTLFSKHVYVKDLQTGVTERVSRSSSGATGNDNSGNPDISADGRYVTFQSKASNLVSDDFNPFEDTFLHDRDTGITIRVSVGFAGDESAGHSQNCVISPDGAFVLFDSAAGNLVPGDTNGQHDIFLRELGTGTNTRISVDSFGGEGDKNSLRPALSDDGTIVAFDSHSTNLVPGDTNGEEDVFVHELATSLTTRISVSTAGVEGSSYSSSASISADGRLVTFSSRASTLVPGDVNGTDDIFLHDRDTGETSIVSIDSAGVYGDWWSYDPSISADGTLIAFGSWSSNLVPGDANTSIDIFVRDLVAETTTRVSLDSAGLESDDHSYRPAMSTDGRFVALMSDATNLVAADTNAEGDIFFHEYADAPPPVIGPPSTRIPFSSSEGFVAIAPTQPGGVTRGTSANFAAHIKVGLVPSGQKLGSSSYTADAGTAAMPAQLSSTGPLVFGASPAYGDAQGGEPIAVHGFNLDDGSGTAAVNLVSMPASAVSTTSNTVLAATTGAGVNPFGNPLAGGDAEVTTAAGTGALSGAFLYGPALTEDAPPRVAQTYPLDIHLQAGSFYQLALGTSIPGLAAPVPPLAGAAEILVGIAQLTGLELATSNVVTVPLPVPDVPGLVGALVELQGVVLTSLAPLAGSFTNRLETFVQP